MRINENPAAKFLRSGINLYAKTAKSLISNSFQAQKKPTVILSKLRWTYGPSDRVRTCGLMVPKKHRTLFLLICSSFWCFLICFTYFLTLLFPLFPSVPEPYVVIYVVKNASRPVSGELSPVPDGKRFSLLLAAL